MRQVGFCRADFDNQVSGDCVTPAVRCPLCPQTRTLIGVFGTSVADIHEIGQCLGMNYRYLRRETVMTTRATKLSAIAVAATLVSITLISPSGAPPLSTTLPNPNSQGQSILPDAPGSGSGSGGTDSVSGGSGSGSGSGGSGGSLGGAPTIGAKDKGKAGAAVGASGGGRSSRVVPQEERKITGGGGKGRH